MLMLAAWPLRRLCQVLANCLEGASTAIAAFCSSGLMHVG